MLDIKTNRKRVVRFNRAPSLKGRTIKEVEQQLHQELSQLFQSPLLSKDRSFLEKIVSLVKELQRQIDLRPSPTQSRQIARFLSTPLGAPFVTKATLLHAVHSYHQQNPLASDLSELLFSMANFGSKFSLQLLRIFSE